MTRVSCDSVRPVLVPLYGGHGQRTVHRTVARFWDGTTGGQADKVGDFASNMALRVWLLRAKRKLRLFHIHYVVSPCTCANRNAGVHQRGGHCFNTSS